MALSQAVSRSARKPAGTQEDEIRCRRRESWMTVAMKLATRTFWTKRKPPMNSRQQGQAHWCPSQTAALVAERVPPPSICLAAVSHTVRARAILKPHVAVRNKGRAPRRGRRKLGTTLGLHGFEADINVQHQCSRQTLPLRGSVVPAKSHGPDNHDV